MTVQLHNKQKEAVNPLKRWFVDRAGRRGGKTIVKIERLLSRGLLKGIKLSRTFETRSVIFLAPTQKQARTIVWESLKQRLAGIGETNESRLEMKIKNETGGYTTIFVGGWENRENYRGMSNVVWIEVDETDTLKDFFISWTEIFYPMLAETGGGAGFSGTPKKENPNLRKLEKEAIGEDGQLKQDWQLTHWTSKDNPYFPNEEIRRAKEEMDKNSFRQEFEAEYVEDAGALFKYTALIDMFTNTVTKSPEKYLIVDIADDGHDKTIFSFWQGLECYRIEQFERLNTEGIVNQIREYASEERIPYSQIAVDAIGVGAGVASSSLLDGVVGYKSSLGAIKTDVDPVRLPNVHYAEHAPLISEYKNLRSQCIFELARLVNDHNIAVKVDDIRIKEAIIEELATYQDASKGDGKRFATPKEDVKELIGRSPDISDTLIMRLYFEIKAKLIPFQSEDSRKLYDQLQNQFARNENNAQANSTR